MFTKLWKLNNNWEVRFSIKKLFQIDQDGETYLARTGRFFEISWDFENRCQEWFCFHFIFLWINLELEYSSNLLLEVSDPLADIPVLTKEEVLEYKNLVFEETDREFEKEMKENGQKLF